MSAKVDLDAPDQDADDEDDGDDVVGVGEGSDELHTAGLSGRGRILPSRLFVGDNDG